MQREIIFRGREKENWKWRYGNLEIHEDGSCEIGFDGKSALVEPETVGQYTGMNNDSGWKIFEGDLLRYRGNVFEVRYSTEQARFLAYLPNGTFNPAVLKNGEIVGNIYDDPELMEV